jgi:hypothetical protein
MSTAPKKNPDVSLAISATDGGTVQYSNSSIIQSDAGEEQEKPRSRTRSRGNPDVTRILAPPQSQNSSDVLRVKIQVRVTAGQTSKQQAATTAFVEHTRMLLKLGHIA